MSVIFHQTSKITYSQQVIKDRNSTLLFNLVRKCAPISRAELARMSGLSPATVTVLVEELLRNKWLRELPSALAPGIRGRRPIQLEVHAEAGYVAILEILSHGYICTLYDICQNKLTQMRSRECAPTAESICKNLQQLLQPYDLQRLLAIHVLYPGLFDEQTGQLGFSAVIDREDMVQGNLIEDLKTAFPESPVLLSNNSTAMAYAVFAADEAETPLLAVSIQEGLSAGVVTDGCSCMPVEMGHIVVDRNGPACQCGNSGCLETICSTPALLRKIREKTDLQPEFSPVYGADCNPKSMEMVAEAFARGDEAVTEVLQEFTYALCCGIISIVNLFSVRSVHLGGAARILGEPFADLVRRTLLEQFRILTGSETVTVELFDDDFEASRKAAVMLSMERLFQRN